MDCYSALSAYLSKILDSDKNDKILILDDHTISILSVLTGFIDILKKNVIKIENVKQFSNCKLPEDVQFVCLLTERSAQYLIDELKVDMHYNKIKLYFVDQITNEVLKQIAEFDVRSRITDVIEIYINYYALDKCIFEVKTDTDLMFVLLSLKSYPVNLQERPSSPASISLNTLTLHEYLSKKIPEFGYRIKPTEYVLIYDRMDDPIIPLLISWDYVSLLHLLFGIKNNKLKITPASQTEIVISTREDKFFADNMYENFGSLTDNTIQLAKSYEKEIERLNLLLREKNTQNIKEVAESLQKFKRLSSNVSKHIELQTYISNYLENLLSESEQEQDLLSESSFKLNHKTFTSSDHLTALIPNESIKMKIMYYLKNKKFYDNSLSQPICDKLSNLKSIKINKRQVCTKLNRYEPLLVSYLNKLCKQYSSIIIYVKGGATYAEASIANEFSKKNKINCIIGSTAFLNTDDYIRSLSETI